MSDGVMDDSHLGTLAVQINHWPQPYKRWPMEMFMVCRYILKLAVLDVQFHTKNKNKRWQRVIFIFIFFIRIMYCVKNKI